MKLTVQKQVQKLTQKDTIAIFICQDWLKDWKKFIPDNIKDQVDDIDITYFKGKPADIIFFPFSRTPNMIIAGLGQEKEVTGDIIRNASAAIIDLCRSRSIKTVHIVAPRFKKFESAETFRTIAEGVSLSNYSFNKYKSKSGDDDDSLVTGCTIYSDGTVSSGLIREVTIASQNSLYCRDLTNETSDNCNSVIFAREAKKLSKLKNVSCRVLGRKEIESLGMGLLSAVNRGSVNPPQLVILHYKGDPKSTRSIAIVGKGITFDSGGINLKPSGHIETMRSDMSGAAVVLCTLKAAAELKIKKNIFAVMPLTDNMLSNNSYRPGDIFTAYNKKTVEIGNTDAEGRLILADAIAYTEDKLKPSCIIDIATLTGACIVALGECVAAYLTPHDELAEKIESASRNTGEKIWRLPIVGEYEDNLKSDFADLTNVSAEKNAGTIIGAIFLKNFVSKTPWVHIDIAGTSWYSKKRGYLPKYATGYGVRLLLEMLKQQ